MIQRSWHVQHTTEVAKLYEQAFGQKFASAIKNKQQRINVLAKCFKAEYSYACIIDGKVAGIAGFHSSQGSLTSGLGLKGLFNELGYLKGLRAALVFSLFERTPDERELVMDGIVVDEAFRGQGIGSKLLDCIIEHAKTYGFEQVRLDVIDSNPRAKKLYESKGFVATNTEYYPYLKSVIGFSGSTTLVYPIEHCKK